MTWIEKVMNLIDLLSKYTALVVAAGLVLVFVFLARSSRFQSWWVRFETQNVRPIAEHRDSFLKYAVILLVIGSLSALHGYFNSDELGELLFAIIVLAMAVLGFFFTIYGIRGVLDRPRNLFEVLIRTTDVINKYLSAKNYTAVMLCEYPSWGALSHLGTREHTDFGNALADFLRVGTGRKLVLVAPDDGGMEKRIKQYSKDYGRTENETKKAVEDNARLVGDLDGRGRRCQPESFKRWQIDQAPRYQMLLIGEQVGGKKSLTLLEAVVWVAARCSDVKDEVKEEKILDNGGGQGAEAVSKNPETKNDVSNEVPILAWHTTAPDVLNELCDSAFFYARTYAKDNSKPDDLQAFLNEQAANSPASAV